MPRRKQVAKLDLDGNVIQVFDSIADAARDAGCTQTTIHERVCAAKPAKQVYNGFRYRFTGKTLCSNERAERKPVVKIDRNGNVLERYESIAKAVTANAIYGFQHEMVRQRCLHLIRNEWERGFTFRFEDDLDYLSPCRRPVTNERSKRIKLIDKSYSTVDSYPSMYAASVALHTNAGAIAKACSNEVPEFKFMGRYAVRFADGA